MSETTLTPAAAERLLDDFARRYDEARRPAVNANANAQAAMAAPVQKGFGSRWARAAAADSGHGSAGSRAAGRRDFMRAVLSGDQYAMKDLAIRDGSGAATPGACLVPSDFRDEIIAGIREDAEVAPYVRVVPVRSDSGRMPRLAANVAVRWGGAENVDFALVDPEFGEIEWRLKRADAIAKLSRELASDAPASLVDFLTSEFRAALAAARDRMIVVGNGDTEPLGLAVDPALNAAARKVTLPATLTYDVLVEIESKLARPYRANARWIMSGDNLRRLRLLKDADGRPLFHRDLVGGRPEASLLGYPVSQADALPLGTILFGDLSQYLWFDREEMGAESSTVAGGAFEKHQVWIKVWERADGRLALPEAFVKAVE